MYNLSIPPPTPPPGAHCAAVRDSPSVLVISRGRKNVSRTTGFRANSVRTEREGTSVNEAVSAALLLLLQLCPRLMLALSACETAAVVSHPHGSW